MSDYAALDWPETRASVEVSSRPRRVTASVVGITAVAAAAVLFSGSWHAGAGTGALQATARVSSSTAAGYQGRITLHSRSGSAVQNWQVELVLPRGERLASVWNGVASAASGRIAIRPEPWTRAIDSGYDLVVGFQVTGRSGQVETIRCTVAGAACG